MANIREANGENKPSGKQSPRPAQKRSRRVKIVLPGGSGQVGTLLARALHAASGAVFLRTETELILKDRRVVPGRLRNAGFTFRFPAWPEAAHDLCRRWLRKPPESG